MNHLFPGDRDEHGWFFWPACRVRRADSRCMCARSIWRAKVCDYVEGKIGYRALSPKFIHRLITRARDERLAYLAVHNHGSDREVGFSQIDYDSHERGYPALLQIARGMPVGALVFGTRSIQAELAPGRQTSGTRRSGRRREYDPAAHALAKAEVSLTRQVTMIVRSECSVSWARTELANCRVGIIGLGGIGSLVAEYLARLGVGEFCLVDDDRVEESNLSRIVGARHPTRMPRRTAKVNVAERVILQANNGPSSDSSPRIWPRSRSPKSSLM